MSMTEIEFSEKIGKIAAETANYQDFRNQALDFLKTIPSEDRNSDTIGPMVDAIIHPDIDDTDHVVRTVAELVPSNDMTP